MSFALSEEGQLLREGFRDLLAGVMTEQRLQETLDGPTFVPVVWEEIARAGWLEVAGADLESDATLTLVHLAEEVGSRLVPVPFSLSAALVVPLLASVDGPASPLALEDVVSGRALVTIVLPRSGSIDHPIWDRVEAVAEPSAQLRLTGRIEGVLFASQADWILVPLQHEAGALAVAAIRRSAAGVDVLDGDELDFARPTATVVLRDVVVGPDDMLGGGRADLRDAVAKGLARYLLCVDGEAVGGASAVVRKTVAYVNERHQFGVPVGSFQAVKHLLADAYSEIELARGLTHHVAARFGEGSAPAMEDIACSRLVAADAYPRAVERCIQCHGGAGFTWEQGLHGWYRQALFYRSHPFPAANLRDQVDESLAGLT